MSESKPQSEIREEHRKAVDELVARHDRRQRRHVCPGYDCSICSLHGDEQAMAQVIAHYCPAPAPSTIRYYEIRGMVREIERLRDELARANEKLRYCAKHHMEAGD